MGRKIILIVVIALVLEFCSIVGFTDAGRAESEFWKGFFWYSWLASMTILMSYGGLKFDFKSLVVTSVSLGFGMAVLWEIIGLTMIPGNINFEVPLSVRNLWGILWRFAHFSIPAFISMLIVFLLKRVVKLIWRRFFPAQLQARADI